MVSTQAVHFLATKKFGTSDASTDDSDDSELHDESL